MSNWYYDVDDFDRWAKTVDPERTNPHQDDDENAACIYTSTGGSHCLAGQFLVDHQLAVPEYGSHDNSEPFNRALAMRLGIAEFLSDDLVERLAVAQNAADSGFSWGKAIEALADGKDDQYAY